jgi:hypothetical protein
MHVPLCVVVLCASTTDQGEFSNIATQRNSGIGNMPETGVVILNPCRAGMDTSGT